MCKGKNYVCKNNHTQNKGNTMFWDWIEWITILYRTEKKLNLFIYSLAPSNFYKTNIIDPSQNAVTIRINNLYTVENEPQFGVSENEIFENSSKYAIYEPFNFDEGVDCRLNST